MGFTQLARNKETKRKSEALWRAKARFRNDENRVTLVLVFTYSMQGTPGAPFIQLITLFTGLPCHNSHSNTSHKAPPFPSRPPGTSDTARWDRAVPPGARCQVPGEPFPQPALAERPRGESPAALAPASAGSGAQRQQRAPPPQPFPQPPPRAGNREEEEGETQLPLRRHLLTAGDPQGGNQIPWPDPLGPGGAVQGDRRAPRAHRVVLAAQRRQRTGSCPVGPTSSCRGAAGK